MPEVVAGMIPLGFLMEERLFWGCLMQLYEMEWVPVKHVLMVEEKGYEMVKLKNLVLRGKMRNVFVYAFEVVLVGQLDLAVLKGEDKLYMMVQEQDW